MKQERWTKECKCSNYIPDEYEVCDWCLLRKYDLTLKGKYHYESMNESCYSEKDVVEALRKAEKEDK